LEFVMRADADIDMELSSARSEREAMEAALERLAPLFAGGSGHTSALFVVSANAGSGTALRFWADAQRSGVAVANPELFPWCLANAACSAISRRFGITGPNSTLLGADDALRAAWSAALYALTQRRAERAFIVEVNFASNVGAPGRLRAWFLRGENISTR
jgi:hypothetical protein